MSYSCLTPGLCPSTDPKNVPWENPFEIKNARIDSDYQASHECLTDGKADRSDMLGQWIAVI